MYKCELVRCHDFFYSLRTFFDKYSSRTNINTNIEKHFDQCNIVIIIILLITPKKFRSPVQRWRTRQSSLTLCSVRIMHLHIYFFEFWTLKPKKKKKKLKRKNRHIPNQTIVVPHNKNTLLGGSHNQLSCTTLWPFFSVTQQHCKPLHFHFPSHSIQPTNSLSFSFLFLFFIHFFSIFNGYPYLNYALNNHGSVLNYHIFHFFAVLVMPSWQSLIFFHLGGE